MGPPALGVVTALIGLMLALGACGGDAEETPKRAGDTPEAAQGGNRAPSRTAERLCSSYRRAVTNVRFNGSSSDQAEDFRAAASVARAARKGTSQGELGSAGRDYLKRLDTLVSAYAAAAAAAAKKDRGAFERALDAAEPADESLDILANKAGLERCSLDEPRTSESRVSQSGFPSLIVPKGERFPPSPDRQVYPLNPDESIVLERGPQITTGTFSPVRAGRALDNPRSGFNGLEATGAVGDDQVPMRGFSYKNADDRGSVAAFSGQGHMWLLVCASRRPQGPSARLKRACARAAETAGFLMF